MNRADSGASQHGDGRLRYHRHVDDDSITFSDSFGFQCIGKSTNFKEKLSIGQGSGWLIRFIRFPNNGRTVTDGVKVSFKNVLSDV